MKFVVTSAIFADFFSKQFLYNMFLLKLLPPSIYVEFVIVAIYAISSVHFYIFFFAKIAKTTCWQILRQCLIIDISGEPQDRITQLFNFIGTKNNTIVGEMCPQ